MNSDIFKNIEKVEEEIEKNIQREKEKAEVYLQTSLKELEDKKNNKIIEIQKQNQDELNRAEKEYLLKAEELLKDSRKKINLLNATTDKNILQIINKYLNRVLPDKKV
ncbi:MAG: hypothetical protein OEZ22_02500 [Spirochaetia bacterium]|nr:hypothetical protein [Spirochaetia bacterium]